MRLDLIGKGGTSRVFRVMTGANEVYAIKRVALDKTDPETMSSYMNEIALLRRLDGNSRIIKLIDSEIKSGPGGSKGHLLMVLECGEIDLARLLSERAGEGVDMIWIAYYWQQVSFFRLAINIVPDVFPCVDAPGCPRHSRRKDCPLRPQTCELCACKGAAEVDRLWNCECYR